MSHTTTFSPREETPWMRLASFFPMRGEHANSYFLRRGKAIRRRDETDVLQGVRNTILPPPIPDQDEIDASVFSHVQDLTPQSLDLSQIKHAPIN